MLATAAKLALITAAVALLATSGDAQEIHRRCAKAKDKVHCTCIFANGGQVYINPGATRRRVGFTTIGEYDAYARCLRNHGRRK
jgi:hypothetical protein